MPLAMAPENVPTGMPVRDESRELLNDTETSYDYEASNSLI